MSFYTNDEHGNKSPERAQKLKELLSGGFSSFVENKWKWNTSQNDIRIYLNPTFSFDLQNLFGEQETIDKNNNSIIKFEGVDDIELILRKTPTGEVNQVEIILKDNIFGANHTVVAELIFERLSQMVNA